MEHMEDSERTKDSYGITSQDWHNTFDALTDFVAVLDTEFRIVRVNRAMADFLKQSPEKLIGQHCYKLMHGRSAPWEGCPHEQMLREGKAVTHEVNDPFAGIPLLVTASPVFNEAGELTGSVHIARDISGLKAVQDDLATRNSHLTALNRLSRRAVGSRSLKEVAAVALDGIREACAPDLALFYLISEEQQLVLKGALPSDGHLNERKKIGNCLCGLAAAEGRPVYSTDIHRDDRCTLAECKEAGMRSFAAMPLIHDSGIIGVLGIASKAERDFAAEKVFLETLAGTVAVVTQNAILFETLQKQSDRLEEQVRMRTVDLESKNAELQRFNKLFVDREFRIKELKEKVKVLESGRQ